MATLQPRKWLRSDPEGLAWAAGVFNGEGSTFLRKANGGKQRYTALSIGQNDREILDIFKEIVESGNVNGPDKTGIYRFNASGIVAEKIIYDLSPWLSLQKTEQALKVLNEVERFNTEDLVDNRRVVEHGNLWMYQKHKCRCELCVEAYKENYKARRLKEFASTLGLNVENLKL